MTFDAEKIKTLLFDLDGTLIDSTADVAASANHLRLGLGLEPLGPALVSSYIGDGIEALVGRLLGREEVAAEVEAFKRHYHEHCVDATRCYPGVAETLAALHAGGYKMAVVTNKPERISKQILDQLGLGGFFGAVLGGNSCANKKPHPEPLLKACEALGADPGAACMIGDSRVDVEAGHNAGMPSLALLGGIGDEALMRRSGPEMILKSFAELTELFRGKL